jgi:hypothetical protein
VLTGFGIALTALSIGAGRSSIEPIQSKSVLNAFDATLSTFGTMLDAFSAMLDAFSTPLGAFSTLPIASTARPIAIGTTRKAMSSVLHASGTMLLVPDRPLGH